MRIQYFFNSMLLKNQSSALHFSKFFFFIYLFSQNFIFGLNILIIRNVKRIFDGKTTSVCMRCRPCAGGPVQGCMEASCESAKRDGLRPRVLGNVVKIIIKAVTTPYYLFVRLTRVSTTPRTVQLRRIPPEVAAMLIAVDRYNKIID